MKPAVKWYSFRWQVGLMLLLIFVSCWYYLSGRFQHPVGSGPAGPPVPAEPFAHVWSTEKMLLLGLGDSITAGFGASSKHSYFDLLTENDDVRYPDMKGRYLKRVFPNLQSLNCSVSYTTSQEHLAEQLPHIGPFPANVRGIVVVTTGGNDLIHDYGKSPPKDGAMYGCTYEQALAWKENFRVRLGAIIQEILRKFPGGCEVFLANIYDPTDGVGDIENASLLLPAWPDGLRALVLFNNVIAEVCSSYKNVHLVDMHSSFLGHGIHCTDNDNEHYRGQDPHYWYFSNVEDPNDRGYDAIRRLFLIEMVRVFYSP